MPVKEKNKGGRPSKYDKIDLELVEKLAGLGLIDTDISDMLDISVASLNNYKKNPKFLESLKKGKVKADAKVTQSLYQRAIGYNHADINFSAYKGEVTQTPYTKYIAPDVTAQIFWLKNRRPDLWRDRYETDLTSGGQSFEFIIKGKNPSQDSKS